MNYDTANIYSELVLDDFEIIGVYIIDNGEHMIFDKICERIEETKSAKTSPIGNIKNPSFI